ncbi:hypothetical protein ANAPRD1_00357 [Anaplasma phagocytophilum]|nr:hypothetical protein ANAPRD1_00357 [Anaplasma phagocytophilum]
MFLRLLYAVQYDMVLLCVVSRSYFPKTLFFFPYVLLIYSYQSQDRLFTGAFRCALTRV